MPQFSRASRRITAFIIWALGLMLFLGLGLWNLNSSRRDAENRLISESGRVASQLASLLGLDDWGLDEAAARAIVAGAMEDERIYAVKVAARQGLLAGQRRNYMWEPVPWDDEISENCVQGINPIKVGGQAVGVVEVWVSPRLSVEEDGLLAVRELWRFGLAASLWTFVFVLVFWQWGDFRRLRRKLFQKDAGQSCGNTESDAEKIVLGLNQEQAPEAEEAKKEEHKPEETPVINASAGRRFQRHHPDSWLVTAGMFRQTFSRGPALISRLYAEGETAGLCHLGRMLEQAAPCIGAERLTDAAREMQRALNDPDCETRAMPVEECARALEEVLGALCGNGQWRSRPDGARS